MTPEEILDFGDDIFSNMSEEEKKELLKEYLDYEHKNYPDGGVIEMRNGEN